MDGFTALAIHLEGDGAFADLPADKTQAGTIEAVATLADGTNKGKPSIAFKIAAKDGTFVIAETTWNLLYSAARAIEARYGPAR